MTLRIAIPKGRLQEPALATFETAGFDVPDAAELQSRRLTFQRSSVEWVLVKDADVPVYVDRGGADVGVAGLDQILEHDCKAYQPVELPFGRCRMMVIGAPGAGPIARTTKIATKYPRIAQSYLESRGIRAEVVSLGGSVELAAVLGLTSHVIDLVETGATVRAHRLELQECVTEIAPRLLVARNSYRTNQESLRTLIARVQEAANRGAKDATVEIEVA